MHLKTRFLSTAVALTLVFSTTGCLQLGLELAMQQARRDSDPKRRPPAMKLWVDGRELNSNEDREAWRENLKRCNNQMGALASVGLVGFGVVGLALQPSPYKDLGSMVMGFGLAVVPAVATAYGIACHLKLENPSQSQKPKQGSGRHEQGRRKQGDPYEPIWFPEGD